MAHTNRGRVILGGLLAGVVINIVEFVTNGVALRESWGTAMQALGKPAELSTGAIVMFNVWGFLLGMAAMWLYADAGRSRQGQAQEDQVIDSANDRSHRGIEPKSGRNERDPARHLLKAAKRAVSALSKFASGIPS